MRRPRRQPEEMKLNITSMMDMFTIILVFLLFSFKARDEQFTMARGVELPSSTSKLDLQDALNVKMSSEHLIVQEQIVLDLVDGALPPDVEIDGHKIVPLYKAVLVAGEVRKRKKIAEGEDPSTLNIAIFQADKRARFRDIDKVMKTAAMAGFPNFRFAVMKK